MSATRRYFAEAEAGKVMHRGKPKKPTTLAIDKGRIERHIKPLLGRRAIEDLTIPARISSDILPKLAPTMPPK
jgi:hypothetical protein